MAIYSTYWFIRTTKFYYRNDWDFKIDFGPPIYRSEFHTESEEVKGKTKYLIFLPTLMIVSIILEIPTIYIIITEVIHV